MKQTEYYLSERQSCSCCLFDWAKINILSRETLYIFCMKVVFSQNVTMVYRFKVHMRFFFKDAFLIVWRDTKNTRICAYTQASTLETLHRCRGAQGGFNSVIITLLKGSYTQSVTRRIQLRLLVMAVMSMMKSTSMFHGKKRIALTLYIEQGLISTRTDFISKEIAKIRPKTCFNTNKSGLAQLPCVK